MLFLYYFLIKLATMASVFVTHGGGPYPLLQKQAHKTMFQQFQAIHQRFPNPKAILIFSAHWEETSWTILDHDNPKLYYDYHGFPPESYNLSYSMNSPSELRNYVKQNLLKNGIELKTNTQRGYDHGVFIPMMMMYPESKIPVIQISILKNLDPEAHFRMGQALRELKKEGFLILGSGSSVHGGFFQEESTKTSQSFDQELARQIKKSSTQGQLLQVCKGWRSLPHSKLLHPREEHLVPLFLNLGASEGQNREQMKLSLYNINLSNYVFE